MRPMRLSPSVLLLGLALTLAACKGSEEPSTPQPTTTARLTGKVALEGAASPEGILVALTGTTLNASTDAQGAFLLEAVPPGTHELTAARQGYTTVRQTVSVSAGESAALSLTLKVARGRLSGVITLEGASTSAGIAVTLTNTTVAATTSAQGRFTLENLPLGTYELVATKDGYTPLRVSVEVQEGNAQSVTQVLARLRGQVVGQVLLEGRANPEGLQVSLEGRSERATTDAQGRFTLENLAPGTYTLQAEKELYATARQPVEVKSAEATSLTLTLARLKGELRGTVLRDDVGPQDNGGITVTLALPGSPLSTSTNDTGGFVFTGVPTGTYEVQARRDAYLEDRQSVTLLANQSTSTQLTLARLRGRIEGQVLLSDGADASGLTVSLSGTNTRATTDAQGRFMLEGIPTGTYALATRKEHHSPLTQSVEVTANSTATPTLLLTRLQPPTLTAVSERGVQGGRLTLTGDNLDYSWDTFRVTVGGVAATEILSRTNTRVVVRLPHAVPPGMREVVMTTEDPARTFSAQLRVVAPTTLTSGTSWALGIKPDGTLAYSSAFSSEPVQDIPERARTGILSVSGGEQDALALREDGSVVAWGRNSSAQGNVPEGLTGVIAISSGLSFNVALKDDGTVTAWGANGSGQSTVPAGLTDVIAINSGASHTLALKADGTVTAWGANGFGQSTVPAGLTGVVQVAAGRYLSAALKTDGSLVQWGFIPQDNPLPPGLSGVTALALSRSGDNYGLAVTSATRVIAWGDVNDVLGTGVPPPNQNNVVALVTGPGFADMALHGDGTVTAWGLSANILDLPAGLVLRVPAR